MFKNVTFFSYTIDDKKNLYLFYLYRIYKIIMCVGKYVIKQK